MLPAFKHAENSELAAIVNGNREKNRELSERYRVKAYTYDDLEAELEKEQVDAVYIAENLPKASMLASTDSIKVRTRY